MLIIIIFLINALYNYYISKIGLVKECRKEENVAVTGAAITFCLKRRLSNVLSNITYSPDNHRAGTQITNTQSTLPTAPDLCKSVSLVGLFSRNSNSYIVSMWSRICVYIYTHSWQYRDTAWAKEIKNWEAVNASCQGKLSVCHFGYACHRFVSPGLDWFLTGKIISQERSCVLCL
jgi:hypothetical protein